MQPFKLFPIIYLSSYYKIPYLRTNKVVVLSALGKWQKTLVELEVRTRATSDNEKYSLEESSVKLLPVASIIPRVRIVTSLYQVLCPLHPLLHSLAHHPTVFYCSF